MNKTLLTVALTWAAIASGQSASADHGAPLRNRYDLQRSQLEHEYKDLRRANRYAFEHQRDVLRAERSRVLRIDCRDTRIARLRAINRQLTHLSRSYAAQNRQAADWYHAERDALRTSYRIARRETRYVGVDATLPRHPAGCGCSVCQPPAAIPLDSTPYHHGGHQYGGHRQAVRHSKALDVAGLILNLLH